MAPLTVVLGRGDLAGRAAAELAAHAPVHRAGDAAELSGWEPGAEVALVVLTVAESGSGSRGGPDEERIDDVMAQLKRLPTVRDARVLVVTGRSLLPDISWSVAQGHVDGVVAAPWTSGNLASYAKAQARRWAKQQRRSRIREATVDRAAAEDAGARRLGPSDPAERSGTIHIDRLRRAPAGGGAAPHTAEPAPEDSREVDLLEQEVLPDSELLRHLEMPVDEAATELLEAVEEVLGPRPRMQLPPGARITVAHTDVDQVFLVVSGRVKLRASTRHGEVTLHHASTGPLVGLLALTDRRHNDVTAVTSTPCEVVPLTLEQLDRALTRDPRVGLALTALTTRALSARLRRAQALHVEKAELATELQQTVRQLEQARADLVDQARLATLGELAAGIAHELNNPVAAVARGVDHLTDDLDALLAPGEIGSAARRVLLAAEDLADQRPLPAREERALRRLLSTVVRDPALVRRLVAAGIREPAEVRSLLRGGPTELARLEAAAGTGAALTSVRSATDHITSLVEALRAHARPDSPDGATEPTGIEDSVRTALRLLGHRLRAVTVTVDIEPDLPPVASRPGQLAQVWTNIVSNAAEALAGADDEDPVRGGADRGADVQEPAAQAAGRQEADASGKATADGTGHIDIRAALEGPEVVVRISDDGPGVPPELQERIFEPRFTTKRGVVRYGLGLGLGITRSIVAQHNGTIGVDSEPGRTVFTVRLPVGTPPAVGHTPWEYPLGPTGSTPYPDQEAR